MGRQVKKFGKSALSVLLAVCLAIPTSLVFPTKAQAATKDFVTPEGLYLISSKEYAIAPGIKETQVITNTADGNDQEAGFAVTIDLSNDTVSLGAGYANNDGSTWGMQTVRGQAYAAEKDNGYNVVAAVNADFFNMATGAPQGALVMNGTVYHNSTNPYFAILNDGTAVIRSGKVKSDVKEAVGGSAIILVNGEIPQNLGDAYYVQKEPRTAVGIKADGSVVLFVGDGRQYPYSRGLTIVELANMMKAFGCVTALNLDGGGSTTFLTEREGSSDLMLQNSPSDGAERTVSSSLFVYSTAKSDGKFDHAVLAPNNDAYTPYASVKFTATGVDAAGGKAELPSNLSYALASESADMGTISADGTFVSSGKEGTVTVNLLKGSEVVGTTSVVITAPDSITFTNDEVSMGFSQVSDLGLTVKAAGRDIIYNADDFVWTLSDPSMGTFDGNIFTSSDSATVTGTITCAYKYNTAVSGSISAIIGKLPTIVWDFEDPEQYTGLYTSNYGRGGIQSHEIVSIDDGEPVRFGQRSLKLNYNFINCGAVTEGACVGYSEPIEIPGIPTGIGMWVYAPEGTAPSAEEKAEGYKGLWLRGYLNDVTGRQQVADYTLADSGVDWEGWRYVEADLTKLAGPFTLKKGMTFRLMFVAGGKNGTRSAGSVYFDNFQFVYGANVDDIDSPVIDSIVGNDTEITDGMVFDTDTITFASTFHDVESKYMTGIDYDVVRMYIDGVNVVEDPMYVLDKGGNKSWYYDVKLANGDHSVKMLVRDGFGNETTETRFFTVKAEANDGTTLNVEPVGSPVLGETFALKVTSNNIAEISEYKLALKLDNHFAVKSVEFADGFTGSYSYKSKELTIEANGTASADADALATIYFDVPATLQAGIAFTYYTTLGSFKTVSGGDTLYSFTVAPQTISVAAPLNIVLDNTIIVGTEGVIRVVDYNGTAVANAEIIYAGTSLGVTNDEGIFVTSAFSGASGKYEISAKSDRGVSYNTFIYSVNAVGTKAPYDVVSNASVNGNTQKSFTWFSNVLESQNQAIAQIALKSDYDANGTAAFADVTGKTEDKVFLGGAAEGYSIVRLNTVNINSLVPGATYAYRVGDGETWSEVKEFSMDAVDGAVNFFIIGDIQAKDLVNNTKVINGILSKNSNYAFGLQTGDAVDSGNIYAYWDELLTNFESNNIGNIDLVHVLGNHEYEGDEFAQNGADVFNLPSATCYSVEYDNVYMAVINYKSASASALDASMEWLANDAAKSNATWKILTMHQPPYYTNIAAANDYLRKRLSPAIEAAGINMVFSGHDHTLARTLPLKGGEVNEKEGVVYYICGSTGEKSYAAINTPEFHFDYLNDSFEAVYTTVQVTDDYIKVSNYDLDGSLLDSYTMESKCKEGHSYIFDGTKLVCEHCHKETDVKSYIGFAKDAETGKKMYLYLGTVKTGAVETADGEYVFDENGLAIDGEYTIERMKYVLDNGKVITKNGFVNFYSNRLKKYFLRMYIDSELVQKTGWYQLEGIWYYVEDTYVVRGSKTLDGVQYKFNSDGSHTVGTFKTNKGNTKYYFAGKLVKGLTEIEGKTYYFSTSNGVMAVNKEMTIGNKVYTFGPEGYATSIVDKPVKPSTGFWKEGGYTYYYVDDVAVKSAWVEAEGKEYYFDANGHMVTKQTVIDNAICTFNADGSLKTRESLDTYNGFITISGSTYFYVDGAKAKGWKNIEDDWYYFLPDTGVMVKASKTIDGVYYKFASTGKLQGGTYKTTSKGTRYYVAGKYVTGKYEIDGSNYYFDKNGYMVKSKTVTSGNMIYTIDENGVIVKEEAKPTRPSTGFWTDGGHTYYYVDDVKVVSAWVEADGKQYYFDADGYMVTKQTVIDNALCSFNADGSLASKEALDTYNGFLTLGSKTYFYENGVAAKGWKNISDNWYYFDTTSGNMNKANKTIDGVYYTFHADGTLKSGAWKTNKSGSRYYYAGTYLKGLQTVDGIIRYFNKSNGYMVTNKTVVVDGVTYIFDENGVGSVYVEPEVEEPTTEEPTAEEPVAEEPKAEEPVAEEPVAEEPVTEEPIVEDPVVENPEEVQVNDAE